MRRERGRIWRSIILLFPTIFIVSLLSFSIVYFAPGDAAKLLLRERLNVTQVSEKQAQEYAEKLGINKSFPKLYFRWLSGIVRGDFGNSLSEEKPVLKFFWSKYKITLTLSVLGILFEILLAFPIALRAGLHPKGAADSFVSIWSVLTNSIPAFWLALITVYVLSVKFRWRFAIGYYGLQSLIVPAFLMACLSSGNLARIIRKKTMDITKEPFVEFALSQGLNGGQILRYHILPHVLPTAIAIVVLDISGYLGGAVLVEAIFNIPGFSGILQKAVQIKDYPLISGSLFFIGGMICILNILADSIYPKLDMRNENELYHLKTKEASR